MNRQPAFAGSFYPAHPAQLSAMLEQLISAAEQQHRAPKALIVPHAGYMYSGPIAASAYARLKSVRDIIKRVVLIGPSHRVGFSGLALSSAQTFSTPLGEIAIDQATEESLRSLPFVDFLDPAHAQEHSLEVQLPFLQTLLSDFKLVPIVAGDASAQQVSQMLEKLWGDEETLIVISSDLSHYHDYLTAQHLDRSTSRAIEHLHYEDISSAAACGQVPVRGLLKLLRQKSLTIKTIDLRNSGDTAGDKQCVVGYGAYVVD